MREKVEWLTIQRATALARATDERAVRDNAWANHKYAKRAQEVTQQIAQHTQATAHANIAGTVSRCLAAVFDDPYEFTIDFERKRGRTEARLGLRRGGLCVDPLTAAGGGVIDVAAFALRLTALVLTHPQRRRLLILDEPFRFVSREYRPRISAMLNTLAEELGVQFIMVTHIPELVTGVVLELR